MASAIKRQMFICSRSSFRRSCRSSATVGSRGDESSNNTTVPLPVNLYDLLQVPKGASIEDCRQAYDRIAKAPENAGYSNKCLEHRRLLLAKVADTLLDTASKSEYQLQHAEVDYDTLPGAIALLQEHGLSEAVVQLSKQWLQRSSNDSSTADVAIAMAGAHCDLAEEEFEAAKVPEGFEHLLEARSALLKHAPANPMKEDIQTAVDEMTAGYLKSRLGFASKHFHAPEKRKAALAYLKNAMWSSQGPLVNGKDTRYPIIKDVRPLLSTDEALWLYEGRKMSELPAKEAYEVAFCLMAQAVSTSNPRLLEKPLRHLQSLNKRMDVSVELAVCHTLLGDLDAALAALHLTHGSDGAPDSGVIEFVTQATAGEGGPEAGACVLVERWVRTVLTEEVPEFYKGRTFTLDYWGSLPEVQEYLDEREEEMQAALPVRALHAVTEGMGATARRMLAVLLTLFGFSAMAARLNEGDIVVAAQGDQAEAAAGKTVGGAVGHVLRAVAWVGAFLLSLVAVVAAAGHYRNATGSRPPAAARAFVPVKPEIATVAAGVSLGGNGKISSPDIGTADVEDIKRTLLAWMEAKALALGPAHDAAALDPVLHGSMLRQWRTRARELQSKEWHWRYEALKITIRRAEMLKPRVATVEADIVERADVMFQGQRQDSYEQDVTVEYRLVRRPSGWQIAGARRVSHAVSA
eukprot:jgi/Ulvmu1/5831/UM025_0089.1